MIYKILVNKKFNFFIINIIGLEEYLHGIVAKEFLKEENGDRIFNLDESGFALQNNSKFTIIAEKGVKNIFWVAPDNITQITALITASTLGKCILFYNITQWPKTSKI